jgi:hypothetical protein
VTVDELINAAEAKLRDAENNLASCIDSLNTHKARNGGVPNHEVIGLAQAQATVGQAYASLALAKTGIALASGATDG